ncbi:unnamed protein product [Darwinula stevensoni]|uniref:Zinc finger protein n=1 Tax=Darwinula stevensoni TaxID=69355 RepID=A0A7R9ABY5_9CRUS|nr:unnamed protein product [Darwinula stevensoni]CAG0899894.1 unnamed protein product [Darwinula stevensoni]
MPGECSSCGETIAGVCYKCIECVDYMICSTCEADGVLHTGHNLLRLAAAITPFSHSVSGNVHRGVQCDSCGGRLRGSRYKCLQCPDFDLCPECEATGTEHAQHVFMRLPSRVSASPFSHSRDGMTGKSSVRPFPTDAAHPGVSCDSCGQRLRGRRFKCLACPDFDLCSDCEQSGGQHLHHPMIRFARPGGLCLPAVAVLPDGLHEKIICNQCRGTVRGHRYKCLQCKDYDLCMGCEASSKHLHHRMLRLPPARTRVLNPIHAGSAPTAAAREFVCRTCRETPSDAPRFVCLQCTAPTYEHCAICERRMLHKDHAMLRSTGFAVGFGSGKSSLWHLGEKKNSNWSSGSIISLRFLTADARCDECGSAGVRYRCLACSDYSLCPTCEEGKPHSNHPMLRLPMRKLSNDVSFEPSATFEHGSIRCTACHNPITGFRYQCVDCLKNLCEKCEEADTIHPEHSLLRFPSFVRDWSVSWYCDVCKKKQYRGARYKCLACPDFDLCSSCAAGQNHTSHPMLRLPFSHVCKQLLRLARLRGSPDTLATIRLPPPPLQKANTYEGSNPKNTTAPTAFSSGASEKADEGDDGNLCKLCLEDELNCAFVDCGHMVACLPCAQKVRNCPICRKVITSRIRIYKA